MHKVKEWQEHGLISKKQAYDLRVATKHLSKTKVNAKGNELINELDKKTIEWEKLSNSIISKHSERFNNILDNLPDKEFVQAFTSIIGYFKPKMQSTQLDANINQPHIIEFVNVSKQFPDN